MLHSPREPELADIEGSANRQTYWPFEAHPLVFDACDPVPSGPYARGELGLAQTCVATSPRNPLADEHFICEEHFERTRFSAPVHERDCPKAAQKKTQKVLTQ